MVDSLELEKRIATLIEAAGFHLISANWTPMRGKQMLRVVADAEDHNITIGECAQLSHAICDLLDAYPDEFPDYRLEVSSPGLKHPLEPWQFNKNVKRKVEVRFEEEGEITAMKGVLQDVDEIGFTVRSQDETRRFIREQVKEVYVLPEF
jgi:ribosome maturation factor RimP